MARGALRSAPSRQTPDAGPSHPTPLPTLRARGVLLSPIEVKALLLLGVLSFFVITGVMAVVFRDNKARGRLRFIRNVGFGYVIAIVLIALWRISQDGF